jgi:cell division initiation protein
VLTPLEIHNKEFSKAFRGYREGEVDEFLDEIIRDYEQVLKENAVLKEQVEAANKELGHYRTLEEVLQKAIIVAQEAAEEVKSSARKEAELLIKEAQEAADRLKEDARERLRKTAENNEELIRQRDLFVARMKAVVRSYLDLLEELKEEESEAPK